MTAPMELREKVARIILPSAFERADEGCADSTDREEIAGAYEIADAVLALPELADVLALREALENLVIAIGMGWDLDGVVASARAALSTNQVKR